MRFFWLPGGFMFGVQDRWAFWLQLGLPVWWLPQVGSRPDKTGRLWMRYIGWLLCAFYIITPRKAVLA